MPKIQTTLKKEKWLKDDRIQNLNLGFNKKIVDLKARIQQFENINKESLKREKKSKKKQRQKLKKENESNLTKFDINDLITVNNNTVEGMDLKTNIFACEVCDKVFGSRPDLENHAVEEHLEELKRVKERFCDNNSDSLKMLLNVPEKDCIFTPEELTHFGMDWEIHSKMMKILTGKNNKEALFEE